MKVAGVSFVAIAALIAVPGVANGQVDVPPVVEDTVESVKEAVPQAGQPERARPAPSAQAPAPAAKSPAPATDRDPAAAPAAPRSRSAGSPAAPVRARSAESQVRAPAAGGGDAEVRAGAAQADEPVAQPEVEEFSGVADPEAAPSQQGDSRLPFTGFELLPLLVLGAAALLSGLVLRRHA